MRKHVRLSIVRVGISLPSLLLAALLPASPVPAQSRAEPDHFDPVAVVRGIEIDRRQCAELEDRHTAVWVRSGPREACIRYYAAGLAPRADGNAVAAVWLNGDVLGPKGENADRRQKGFGPDFMVRQVRGLSERFGVPFVFVGRPGTYGSSGRHHTLRGRPLEADLVDAALDALVERYGIRSLALGGHSGGGTLVAEMLAQREDLKCAVISSGASAYRAYLETRGLLTRGARHDRFDPYLSLDRIPRARGRRIFVIGDPREANVPFATQRLYFEGLASRGHAAWLLPLERATDARRHGLVDYGEAATGLCAAGSPTHRIIETLDAMPEQGARRTN